MCKVLKVSQSGYYRWKTATISQRLQKKTVLKEKITALYFESKQRYGSPRITIELNILGYKISRVTVAKYMRELGLKSKLSKKFKITTDSKHNYLLVENVLNRQFVVSQPSKAWVSDITYIHTKEGFLYLTTVMDLYDRKIIGWSLSDGMSTNDPSDSEQAKQTTLASWKMAIRNRTIQNGLIFHCFASSSRALGSDRGVQYAINKFTNVLESYKVTRSMSRTGNCWDNAVAESFFKSLKTELIYGNKLISKEEMKLQIFDPSVSELAKQYIELWYNQKRRHSALKYMTIKEFNNKSNNYKNVA